MRLEERSDATMKTFLLTARYLPFPQPISRPMEPGARLPRNRSINGHGYIFVLVWVWK
jgi:hypothetical protein